jgi:hypothetical protein
LNKLGVPSAKDVAALIARIDALNASVQQLSAGKSAPKAAPQATAKAAPKPVAKPASKTAAKKAPARKVTTKAPAAAGQENPQ